MADDRNGTVLTKLAEMLGLPRDTPTQTIFDTAMRRIDEAEAAHDRRVAAAAVRGTDCPPPPRGSGMERVLDWAQATKRMSAAARPQWEANWQKDPEGTEALVRILARVDVEPMPVRSSAARTGQTASGLDVSRLPARLQAAAAAEPDRGKVYRWIERYGTMTDEEVGPAALHLEGETDLAADVRRRENEARVEATQALNESINANNAAYQAQLAEEHQRRVAASVAEHERRRRGE
jgi:hypothetical protein